MCCFLFLPSMMLFMLPFAPCSAHLHCFLCAGNTLDVDIRSALVKRKWNKKKKMYTNMGTDLDERFLSCLIFIFQHCFWMFVTQTLIWPDSTGITQHIEKAFCKWVKITNYLYIKKIMYLLEFNCIIVFFGWGCWVPHHCREEKTLTPNLHGERAVMQQS